MKAIYYSVFRKNAQMVDILDIVRNKTIFINNQDAQKDISGGYESVYKICVEIDEIPIENMEKQDNE